MTIDKYSNHDNSCKDGSVGDNGNIGNIGDTKFDGNKGGKEELSPDIVIIMAGMMSIVVLGKKY